MKIEKMTKRHNKNFTVSPQSRNESVRPKEQHEQGRGSPDRDSDINNELQHSLNPLSFSVYIIPYLAVKKQRILDKIYVKLLAGQFLNKKK